MKLILASIIIAAAQAANPFLGKSKNNAKSAFASNLVAGARRLNDADEEYEINISGYSVKFEKCQFVKSYDDELAEEEDSETVLATKRFVIFKLCPDDSCSSCNYNYGEYMIDLDTYLQTTVNYMQELQEEMCNQCDENCAQDEDEEEDNDDNRRRLEVDCDSCQEECYKIENMEDNGYIDATEYLECAQIVEGNDDNEGYFAGPMCASSGTKIKIGVFEDEDCNILDNSKNIDDYLYNDDGYQVKLSHALLKTVYADTCISCLVVEEEDENDNDDGNNNDEDEEEEEPEVNEMCQELYEAAAKCEKSHGFDDGYEGNNDYDNQIMQEEVVCDFISSIEGGTYDDNGEISLYGSNTSSYGGASTTGGQKFALTFFILGSVALAAYSAMLHGKLTKGGKAGLTSQGGAMA